ncbi:MAG: hypothetical protein D6715_11980 [Calditrichaeota bacterium]|nr:MAG: hypothetical protein D6715_11980 [Calditrichota bacterium]
MAPRCWNWLCSFPLRRVGVFLLWILLQAGSVFPQTQPRERLPAWTNQWVRMFMVSHRRSARLPEFEDAYGAVFRDLNGDHRPDLYVVCFRNLNRLFIQRPDHNIFLDWTIQSGLGGNLMSRGEQNLELGASSVDMDGDGRPDMLITGWGETTRLFRQERDHHFRDVTRRAGLKPPLDANAGAWADVDLDGDLDLFLTDEHYHNHFYLNNGIGHFSDQTEAYGLADSMVSQSAGFADLNNDGFPELYVCNWFHRDLLFLNLQGEGFRPAVPKIKHLTENLNSNGVAFGDVDNDGRADLLVTDRNGNTQLYLNRTDSASMVLAFEPAAGWPSDQATFPTYGAAIADFNNDGLQDIFLANIGPNQLFLNAGSASFHLVYQQTLPPHRRARHYSTGLATADLDRDGDLDLFVANKDTNSILYINPLEQFHPGHFVQFSLEGVRSNRDGIGTRIWLYTATLDGLPEHFLGYREVVSTSGYLSQSEPLAHFGVNRTGPLYARIVFPSGRQIIKRELYPGFRYHFKEYGGLRGALFAGLHALKRNAAQTIFWINLLLFLLLMGIITVFTALAIRRYRWKNQRLAGFLIAQVGLFYLILWVFPDLQLWQWLSIQLVLVFTGTVILAFFMEKIQRLEAQRSAYRDALLQFSNQLIFIKDNPALHQALVNTIQQTMGVQFVLLLEKQADRLVPAAAAGSTPPLPDTLPVPPKSASQKTQLCQWLQNSGLAQLAEAIRPGACLPLSRAEKTFGVLVVGPLQNNRPLPAEDEHLLQILANQAAIAIENNRFIEETKQLIQKVTEAETRIKYVKQLEEKNQHLRKLYRDLQETQEQLVQSEKMASLGLLVAGVAHEVNNPVSYIYANLKELKTYLKAVIDMLDRLKEQLPRIGTRRDLDRWLKDLEEEYDLPFIRHDLPALIEESIRGTQRVRELVQNLRNFSRLDEAEVKEVDLHEGLESALALLSHELKHGITVHRQYGKLPPVRCHAGQINQVFMNILLNAVQALGGRGNIWITTRNLSGQVEVEIRDDGPGIPRAIQKRIFDPFFTTKPVGKGTGLGLSISYRIIQQHGGSIQVQSEEGRGTSFVIRLPLVGTSPEAGGQPWFGAEASEEAAKLEGNQVKNNPGREGKTDS